MGVSDSAVGEVVNFKLLSVFLTAIAGLTK